MKSQALRQLQGVLSECSDSSRKSWVGQETVEVQTCDTARKGTTWMFQGSTHESSECLQKLLPEGAGEESHVS